MKDFFPVLVILGLGGVVIYLLTRPKDAPLPVAKPSNCGASYLGIGANIPCEYLAAGIKELADQAGQALQPVGHEIKTATQGIQPWEYIATPVAITHVGYNEAKRLVSYLNPF